MPTAIRHIVAGVATPDAGDPTLADAAVLALATGAELHLVHAFDPPALNALAPDAHSAYMHERESRDARLRNRLRAAATLVAPQAVTRAWVFQGSPGDAIVSVARRVGAGLVVVGASHHGALGQAVLGTAAQRVIRASPAPVLVLRQPFLRPLRRVLLTTDFSELSAAAHDAGLDLLEALFAHDLPEVRSLVVVAAGLLPPPLPRDTLLHAADAQLAAFLAARAPREYAVRRATRVGDPAGEIVTAAEELDTDLLVLGTHARHGVERFFVGSVAEAALAAAPCNVLVVPPAPAAAEAAEEAAPAAHHVMSALL